MMNLKKLQPLNYYGGFYNNQFEKPMRRLFETALINLW